MADRTSYYVPDPEKKARRQTWMLIVLAIITAIVVVGSYVLSN